MTSAISLVPVEGGWAVMLIDGRELARFTGPGAENKALQNKALRYAASTKPVRRHPPIDMVRHALEERAG